MKSTLLMFIIFATLAVAVVSFAASGDRIPAGKVPAGTPASSTAACTQGQQKVTAKFVYTCMTSNVWKRYSSASY